MKVYLVEGTRNEISSSVLYLLNVEGDPLTYGTAMASHDNAFGNRLWMTICNPSWEITLEC